MICKITLELGRSLEEDKRYLGIEHAQIKLHNMKGNGKILLYGTKEIVNRNERKEQKFFVSLLRKEQMKKEAEVGGYGGRVSRLKSG